MNQTSNQTFVKKTLHGIHILNYGKINKIISKNYLTFSVHTSWNIYICSGTCRLLTLKREREKNQLGKSYNLRSNIQKLNQ